MLAELRLPQYARASMLSRVLKRRGGLAVLCNRAQVNWDVFRTLYVLGENGETDMHLIGLDNRAPLLVQTKVSHNMETSLQHLQRTSPFAVFDNPTV